MLRTASVACFALVLIACGSESSTAPPSTSPAVAASTPSSVAASANPSLGLSLTAADRAEVAQLEKRPLRIPAASADGSCVQGPFTPAIDPYANGSVESDVYGAGPVYGVGSNPLPAGRYEYFDVTYFTSPGVHGVVLVRINDLSGKYQGRFVSPLAIGQSLGTDTIDGKQYPIGSELALPTDRPPANTPAPAAGWGVWHVRQGIDSRFTCAAIQIDTESTTEVILGD